MRLRLLKPRHVGVDGQTAADERTTEGDVPRVNQRTFLKTLAAAIGAAGAAQVAREPEVAHADTIATNVTVDDSSGTGPELTLRSAYGQIELFAGYSDGWAYLEAGNPSWTGNINGLRITGYGGHNLGSLQIVAGTAYVQGNLGVGTSSPATTLDVNGTIRSTTQVEPTSGTGTEITASGEVGYIHAWDRTNARGLPLALNFAGTGVGVGCAPAASAMLDVAGFIQTEGQRMYINRFDNSPTGNFWFCTTAAEPYSVFLAFTNASDGGASAVSIAPRGNTGVYVNSVGQVGVGFNAPTAALHVVNSGTIQVGNTRIADSSGSYYS